MYAIERELEILKACFKLSLNIRKTKFMVFGIKKDIDEDIQLKICDAEIDSF